MARTPYENGMQQGGQIDPSEISLEENEQIYQYEVDGLPEITAVNPGLADEHEQYMQGWITGARQVFQK